MPLNGEDRFMSSQPIPRDLSHQNQPDTSEAHQRDLPNAERRPADAEMARVLHTQPLRMASDPSSGTIAHWKHEPLHDVVEPMTDHVIMAYNGSMQRVERRSGRSVAIGTFRPGVVIIIPEGSTGLSPHAWLRQYRLERAMNMLRDHDASVVSVAAALGYSSQTAFAAAFRKLTGETPSDWRRRMR
jgi:hypothetical protein